MEPLSAEYVIRVSNNTVPFATPHRPQVGEIGVLVFREGRTFETLTQFRELGLVEVDLLPALSFHLETCLGFTVKVRMAPEWIRLGSVLVNCEDFLTFGNRPSDAVNVCFQVNGNLVDIIIQAGAIRFHALSPDDLKINQDQVANLQKDKSAIAKPGEKVLLHCMPNLGKGTLTSLSFQLPSSSPFSDYQEFTAYWKDMYGYQLPPDEDSQVFLTLQFSRKNSEYVYPSCCITAHPPTVLRGTNPKPVLQKFLKMLNEKFSFLFAEDITEAVSSIQVAELNPASQYSQQENHNLKPAEFPTQRERPVLPNRRQETLLQKLLRHLNPERKLPDTKQVTDPQALESPYFCVEEVQPPPEAATPAAPALPPKNLNPDKESQGPKLILTRQPTSLTQPKWKSTKPIRNKAIRNAEESKKITDFFTAGRRHHVATEIDVEPLMKKMKPVESDSPTPKFDIVNLALNGQLSKAPVSALQNWLKEENVPFFLKAKRDELVSIILRQVRKK